MFNKKSLKASRQGDSMILYSNSEGEITQWHLDSLNVEQARAANKENLDGLGGIDSFIRKLGVNPSLGRSHTQLKELKEKFGSNQFPESPMSSFLELFFESFQDAILIILMCASAVSLGIGIWEDPRTGWIEGTAILIAVFLVAIVTAGNNYTKELQFRALEKSSQRDERCSVVRDGAIERINPVDLVVGDIIILQSGDSIPADCILLDEGVVSCNESALTGEAEDLPKSREKDCFLLSSCLLTEAEDKIKAVVIGIGMHSQWGKIKANLVSESVNTPLQDKLEDMAGLIGYIGTGAALGTFVAMVASIWLRHHGEDILDGFVEAFIISVTIIVVAIPEGLPLAVTISLAYSTKKMYEDQCFIRVLAACETMGNATNLCSDKTGTLTENRMTVVETWMGDKKYSPIEFEQIGHSTRASSSASGSTATSEVSRIRKGTAAATGAPAAGAAGGANVSQVVKDLIVENSCINRTAYLVTHDANGNELSRPNIIGNKTEGALILMSSSWGYDYNEIKTLHFHETTDRLYAFNSSKKRSTAVVHRPDGTVRLYVKGAPEWILTDCTFYLKQDGSIASMTQGKKKEIEDAINAMTMNARRTLCLAHKDFKSHSLLPPNWIQCPPDNSGLCCDCIVGIIDPLRSDVNDAVAIAQGAGVTVRMVTGDNLNTACAIARQCGILTPGGLALEGPVFRSMTPGQVDAILPRLQVLARSSPEDKYLLVTRLNGYAIPSNQQEWEAKHCDKPGMTWARDKDKLLPGYREEWEASRPDGGHVVGVTGDGTNDAPALKAADVGLAMGITGTKVAQSASDIVILDDKFSSIVRAIMWGRSVYDNIRKFLQFQLTVNIVALTIVFIGAVAGFSPPLNAVMMLWVNLIMDTMGALALGTESPTLSLLQRKPYKRTASLISRPMWRNILCQSFYQIILLLFLLFYGNIYFSIPKGDSCEVYSHLNHHLNSISWDPDTGAKGGSDVYSLTCSSFEDYCGNDMTSHCYETQQITPAGITFSFSSLDGNFAETCMECYEFSYVHTTIIFNAFVFCQIFNEFNARSIFSDVYVFSGLSDNPIFLIVIVVTVLFQYLIVTYGGDFTRTSPLDTNQWLQTVGFGSIAIPVGFLMRFIPAPENPEDFFTDNISDSSRSSFSPSQRGLIQASLKGDDIEAYSQLHPHPSAMAPSSSARAAYNPLQATDQLNGTHTNGSHGKGRNGQQLKQ